MENEKPFQKKSEKCKASSFELQILRLFEKADDRFC